MATAAFPNDPPQQHEQVTIEQVTDWVAMQGTKGDMGGASARLRVTAIQSLAACIAEDEPKNARYLLDNIEKLRERWARKNPQFKADTAHTYSSRARATLHEYFKWAEAPADYTPPRSPVKSVGDAPKKTTEKKSAPKAAAHESPPTTPPPPQQNWVPSDVRSLPLGANREPFKYVLPKEGLQVRDAMRIAFHLITMCEDYDPTVAPLNTVAMVLKRQES